VKLIRNLKTETVHRPGCSSRGVDFSVWVWAAGKTLGDVKAATIAYPWLHVCRICMPGVCQCRKCGAA
jgi:hypothetical protein